MKLVYLWIDNYRDFVIEQGFSITKDLNININYSDKSKRKLKIIINENCEYENSKGLYGKNIVDATAIIGENGSGKTTIATMIMDFIYEVPLMPNGEKNREKSVQIYIDENIDYKPIKIFYHNVDIEVESKISKKIDYLNTEDILGYLYRPSTIYISNTFNIAELNQNYYERNLCVGKSYVQQMYTPAIILKNSAENFRKSHGYRTSDNKYLKTIHIYADNMSKSDVACFIKRQEELFLNCYFNAPSKIKESISIFKRYILEVNEFGKYKQDIKRDWNYDKGNYDEDFTHINEVDLALVEAKRIYYLLKKSLGRLDENSMWLEVYVVLLSEVYMVFKGFSNHIIKKIEYIANGKLKEIDADFLHEIKKEFSASYLGSAPWCEQIIDCINQIDEYYFKKKKKWTIGERQFEYSKDEINEEGAVEWYFNELKKENSFFRRNLNFKQFPTSSGELALVNLFSYIDDAVSKLDTNKDVILIIDEIDAYLHPRWQQTIFDNILSLLKYYQKYKFQIIITSHSPIILSDFPRDHIIKIKKSKDNKYRCVVTEQDKATFGANISMLFYDSFFMNDGDIGEFSKRKIKEVIELVSNNKKNESNNISISDKQAKYIIENIGEEIVRRKLINDYKRKYNYEDSFEEKIRTLNSQEKQRIIQYIKQMRNGGEIIDD